MLQSHIIPRYARILGQNLSVAVVPNRHVNTIFSQDAPEGPCATGQDAVKTEKTLQQTEFTGRSDLTGFAAH